MVTPTYRSQAQAKTCKNEEAFQKVVLNRWICCGVATQINWIFEEFS